MARVTRKQDAEVRRILDRLGLTPQQFLDFNPHPAPDPLTRASEIDWTITRPSRLGWPFTLFWRINFDTLNEGLRSMLDPLGVGYCYMIRRNGKLKYFGSSGWARLPDDGQIPWLFHIPMNIASVSKFITAIATIRLLRDLKLPVTTPIAAYLPQYWTFGAGIRAITFDNLLRQESGLGGSLNVGGKVLSGPVDFATAKDQVALGSSGTGPGKFDYKNINFTLLRIMFATLTGAVDPSFDISKHLIVLPEDKFWDYASFTAYINHVNDVVFMAASIDPRGFDKPDNSALAYATPPVAPGWSDIDTSVGAGTSGWYLSISELVRLLGEFRRGGSMMGTWRAKRLMASRYGLDDPIATRAGTVYRKGGRWGVDPRFHDSAIFLMPGDAEMAIFVNSWDGTGGGYLGNIPQLIKDSIEIVF
jgi:CubicO group peptidase (beta-lactamase class C family)